MEVYVLVLKKKLKDWLNLLKNPKEYDNVMLSMNYFLDKNKLSLNDFLLEVSKIKEENVE
jgi:hypothetical protein